MLHPFYQFVAVKLIQIFMSELCLLVITCTDKKVHGYKTDIAIS